MRGKTRLIGVASLAWRRPRFDEWSLAKPQSAAYKLVRDGVPYAIDFMNPAPDMDLYSLTPHYFDWVVKHMADMAIRLAKEPRRQAASVGWEQLFKGRRNLEDAVAASPVINAPLADAGPAGTYASHGAGGGGDDGRGGYLIGGGRAGEPPPPPPGPSGEEDPPAADELSAAPDGGAESLDASGYLIGGGRAGEPPPPDGGFAAADADGVDSADFLVGETAAGLEFEPGSGDAPGEGADPGDTADEVVDEEASEGHA